ncbi:hypothetical protein N2152v2_004416 [Parachlorella kessleri]
MTSLATTSSVGQEVGALLNGNQSWMSDDDLAMVQSLLAEGQEHLFHQWPPVGEKDDEKRQMMEQLRHLDRSYNGGLVKYIQNAKKLLRDSKEGKPLIPLPLPGQGYEVLAKVLGVNPFEGCEPSVPEGEKLDFGSEDFRQYERLGAEAAAESAFVLVAGGLGERLGYSGIKVALPIESASGACFLQHYVESILALQRHAGALSPAAAAAAAPAGWTQPRPVSRGTACCDCAGDSMAKAQKKHPGRQLPLVIMTSDDTHARTQHLLEEWLYFGADPKQITLLKQEKVACLSDNDAHLALEKGSPFRVQTKPHGHGDVHMLLHSSGIAEEWAGLGFKWVCFFQDTNGLVFRALPAALGVSVANDYDVNSLAVPRKAKEAIGAITRLTMPSGRNITINVEYNQLDPLLRATISPEGDVNDATGFSPFPGNINQLVLKLSTYVEQLHRHGGVISEFVNPKYADASKTAFKSSTRLECMMQDYPKTLPDGARVGFTVVNQVWAAYSPVKNSPADARAKGANGDPSHSAASGELDIYKANCQMLRMLGAKVADPQPVDFLGLPHLELWPRVAWSPLFACTFDDLQAKVEGPNVSIGSDAALVIQAPEVSLRGLDLRRGALVIKAPAGADVVVSGLSVDNAGWRWEALQEGEQAPEEERIRGFRVVKDEQELVEFTEPGSYHVPAPA